MTLELPPPIASYFAADRSGGPDAVARCFAEDAVVRDERQSHAGHDAIRRWQAEATAKFRYSVEPRRIDTDGARIVVTCHLVGDFPGSPIDLRYAFVLAGGRISALDIAP